MQEISGSVSLAARAAERISASHGLSSQVDSTNRRADSANQTVVQLLVISCNITCPSSAYNNDFNWIRNPFHHNSLSLGMLGRLEISRTITFLSTVGQSSTSCHQKCHHTQLLMARIDIPSNIHHLRHLIDIQETMFNVFFQPQREQTLSEPLLRDITNVDRGT